MLKIFRKKLKSKFIATNHVISVFEQQVLLFSEQIALTDGKQQLSYQELNQRANQLARYLQQQGVTRGSFVGIFITRTVDMIVAMLGILKAGGAYVPIAANSPKERVAHILRDADTKLIICNEETLKILRGQTDLTAFAIDEDWSKISELGGENLPDIRIATDPIYVIYTSGSTGKPKGVIAKHEGVVNLVKNADYVSITRDDIFLQLSPYEFDGSTFEIWGAFLNGAKLVLMPPGMPALSVIADRIQNYHISIMFITTQLFNSLVDHRLTDLIKVNQILFGGESASMAHIKKFLTAATEKNKLRNIYGVTECTTFSISYLMSKESVLTYEFIPIGKPIAATEIHVLDAEMQPVPINTPGELYIGGLGLTRGYLNDEIATEKKFIINPFSQTKNKKLYKTGDIVQLMDDGNIKFIGRCDNQIKIRGFRVSLEEIEFAIKQYNGIKEVVVGQNEQENKEKKLVAYIIPTEMESFQLNKLKEYLKEKVVSYMIPDQFIILDEFLLNSNGKIDRKQLPTPDQADIEDTDVPHISQLENDIEIIWREELRLNKVSLHDNFFDIGGHSLLAINVLDRLQQHPTNDLLRQLKISDVFKYPTIQALSSHVLASTNSTA